MKADNPHPGAVHSLFGFSLEIPNKITQNDAMRQNATGPALWGTHILQAFFLPSAHPQIPPCLAQLRGKIVRDHSSLKQAFASLSPSDQAEITKQVGRNSLSEIFSLSETRSSADFSQGALSLGLSLSNELSHERMAVGANVLGMLLEKEGVSEAVKAEARHRLDVMEGKGSPAAQLVQMGREVVSGLKAEPEMLLPMVWAGPAGRVVHYWRKAEYVAALERGVMLGRGLKLRAATWAFAAENTVFSMGGRWLRSLKDEVNTSIAEDFLRSGATLGILHGASRVAGGLFAGAARGLKGTATPLNGAWRAGQVMTSQLGVYTGLVAEHALLGEGGHNPWMAGLNGYLNLTAAMWVGRAALNTVWRGFEAKHQALTARLHELSRARGGEGTLGFQQAIGSVRKTFQEGLEVLSNSGAIPLGANAGGAQVPRPLRGSFLPDHIFAATKSDDPPGRVSGFDLTVARPAVSEPPEPPTSPTMPSVRPSDPDSMIGLKVGNYIIENVLGQGAMGVVYKGKHKDLPKEAAIKFAGKDPLGQQGETDARFLREAKAAASIDNPHIVAIYDFGELSNGQRYLTMELLKGTPLDKVLEAAKGEPLPLPRLLNITHQLTVGMEAAHEAGIVHRDLKPSNIFLTRGSRGPDFVKILDFGIAYVSKSTTKLTERGVPIGTPDYLSPEQATGEPVDLRADIYSLGVILYELATGRVPFEGANQYEVVGKHIYAEPLPPRKQVSNPDLVPLDLEAIILKCLAKDPKKRYQSMREVGAALEQVGGGGFITSIHPQPITPSPPPSEVFVEGTGQGRRRLLALAALLSGAMLVGGSATVLWMRKKDEDSPSPTGPSTAPVTTEKPAPPAASSAKIIEPEKPQASVSVKITVKPKDARVSMNGQELGNGDMSIDLEAGQRIQVEIEKRGYQSQKLTLDGSKTHVPIELKPIATKSVPIKPPPPPPSSKPTEKKKPREFGEGVPSPW